MVYKNYHCYLCTFCRSIICTAYVVKFVPRSKMLPYEAMGRYARLWKWLCCEGKYFLLTAFPPVNLSAAVLHWACTERVKAFRSEQSRHGWKDYYRSFALTKNLKYVKLCPPNGGQQWKLNNTANAGRIVSKPKRQGYPSCVFAWYHVTALAIAAIPQEKGSAPKSLRCRSEKEAL